MLILACKCVEAGLEKATWAASFRRVGWDFRPALFANSN
jgi:hypothetical protein